MVKRLMFLFFALYLGTTLYGVNDWSETGKTAKKRCGFNAALLTDGRFMVWGSNYSEGMSNYEIFDPAFGEWTILDSAARSGSHNLGILLYDGRVLHATNWSWHHYMPWNSTWDTSALDPGLATNSVFTLLNNGDVLMFYEDNQNLLYHPDLEVLEYLPNAPHNHKSGAEVKLASGNVLVAGGFGFSPEGRYCSIYYPVSKTWSSVANMAYERDGNMMVLLPPEYGSKVLVAGGGSSSDYSELYDEVSNTWTPTTGNLTYAGRDVGTISLLPDGKALIIGGGLNIIGRSCELYDPATQTWSMTDTMEYPRNHLSSVVLQTGKVLAVGSIGDTMGALFHEIYDPTNGFWSNRVPLQTGRCCAAISMLPILHTTNCSTNILIAGGENGSGALSSCELYNYSLNAIKYTGSLNTARTHHTANLLAPALQQVLVAGGRNGGGAISTSEIYSMVNETWSYSGNLNNARYDHTATMLKDGRIIVTGGESAAGTYLNSCEIYNSGAWANTSAMSTPRARHSAIILLNGNIMVIGGETTGGNPTATCEIWNGTDWTSVPAASMSTARSLHTATLLQSGRVLVVGGMGAGGAALNSCEIYDPTSNTWTTETPITTARYAHNATLLYSGLVLVSGGTDGTSYYSSCEIFDPGVCNPVTGLHQWKTVPGALANTKAYHASVLIPIDKPYILSIGGTNGSYLTPIEQFDIGLGYIPSWQSTITNYPSVTAISDSMNITGSLFRGVSEADGGNYCHTVSNDHPIISLVRVGGGNWQGNGGGEILTMPVSTRWDTAQTTVHPQISDFQGYYRLWSIVNGIPCKWYADCPNKVEEKQTSSLKTQKMEVYPNPTTLKTGINFLLSKINGKENINLQIYNLSGRLVKEILATDIKTVWDGKDNNGKVVKAGMYFYNAKCDNIVQKGKFIILK